MTSDRTTSQHHRHARWDDALAPEEDSTTGALAILCPFCHSQDVELLSLFGSQLLTDQYYCRACHTPFEHVRDQMRDADH